MRATISAEIAASPETVFRLATDFANAANVVEGIVRVEMLTPGPVAAGTRFRETRVMFGREATEEMTVTEIVAPRRVALLALSHGTRYESSFTFAAIATGTRVTMDFQATPLTLAARIMGWLMTPMIKKSLLSTCAKDLDDIKRAAEKTA